MIRIPIYNGDVQVGTFDIGPETAAQILALRVSPVAKPVHADDCASRNRMLLVNPPRPAACSCGAVTGSTDGEGTLTVFPPQVVNAATDSRLNNTAALSRAEQPSAQDKPVSVEQERHKAEPDEEAVGNLMAWSQTYEYYYDAYASPDAAFPEQVPTAKTLCEAVQIGARLIPLAVRSLEAEIVALRTQVETSTKRDAEISAKHHAANGQRDNVLADLALANGRLEQATAGWQERENKLEESASLCESTRLVDCAERDAARADLKEAVGALRELRRSTNGPAPLYIPEEHLARIDAILAKHGEGKA